MLVLLLLARLLAAAAPEGCAALCCRTAGCAEVPAEVRRRAVCYYDHCLVTSPQYTRCWLCSSVSSFLSWIVPGTRCPAGRAAPTPT